MKIKEYPNGASWSGIVDFDNDTGFISAMGNHIDIKWSAIYKIDTEPLYRFSAAGGLMKYTYTFYYEEDKKNYHIVGLIEENGKKNRVFESVVKRVASKPYLQSCCEAILTKYNKKKDKDGWSTGHAELPDIREPMLLHRWDKHKKKDGEWLVGTKLDGLCSIYLPEKHDFYSRKRSIFDVRTLKDTMINLGAIGAHGEIYKHGYTWEQISGAVSRGSKETRLDSTGRVIELHNRDLEFHMFDRHDMPDEVYLNRLESLLDLQLKSPLLHVIPSVLCKGAEEVDEAMEGMLKLGFEGAVARRMGGMYRWDTRSHDVLKAKPLFSKEFLLHSITYDNDAKVGKMISYNLEMSNGDTFKATPADTKIKRAEDYEVLRMHPLPSPLWMTVEYRDCYANGKPKFAVAKGFRDDINFD